MQELRFSFAKKILQVSSKYIHTIVFMLYIFSYDFT